MAPFPNKRFSYILQPKCNNGLTCRLSSMAATDRIIRSQGEDQVSSIDNHHVNPAFI